MVECVMHNVICFNMTEKSEDFNDTESCTLGI